MAVILQLLHATGSWKQSRQSSHLASSGNAVVGEG